MPIELVEIVVILTYLSFITEIVVFPVPSVASSYQLIAGRKSLPEGLFYTKIQNLKLIQKIILLVLPTIISVIAFCTPLILIIISKLFPHLLTKPEKIGFVLLAMIFILFGRIVSLYSVMKIRKSNRQVGTSFDLKTGSIFSVSRNPILMGLYLTFIGMIVLFPYWYMTAAFVYFVAHMHVRILIEESFLKFKFGDKYLNYMKQTKRYF